MRTLIRFIREAWPLVRRRRTMSTEAYERAKAVLLAKYTLEQVPEEIEGREACTVVMRHGNQVRTISGIADFLGLAYDKKWSVDDFGRVRCRPNGGLTLTIHLDGEVAQELQPYDSKEVAE